MPFLGIDLGTTFSAMAYLDANGNPTTILNSEGDLTTPSVVLFERSGDIVVGREARRAALSEPESVAECAKRHMGDAVFPKLINGKSFSPVEISGLILLKLSQDARQKISTIDGVVITVPAYFDEARRQATARAGKLAGLNVLDIINEPTAAALAYIYRSLNQGAARLTLPGDTENDPPRIVLVYDLGGGTFDVTILRVQGKQLTVLATTGDVRLGGRDWDDRLFKHMADRFLHSVGEDPRDDPTSVQNLMLLAEDTKKVLSSRKQAKYVITHAGRTFADELTRDQFNELTQDLLYRSENRINRVIKQAKLTWPEIDQVLAVGGSTRMPQVLEMLRRVTGKVPDCSLSPDEAVAHGAAVHAAICASRPAPSVPPRAVPPPLPRPAAVPPPLPRTAIGNSAPSVPLPLPPFTPPAAPKVAGYFKTQVVDLLRSIRTTNVNAHTLGVITKHDDQKRRVAPLIHSNTQLPCSIKRRFGTAQASQATVTVRVVEGESEEPDECLQVGSCSIERLPIGLPKGSPIEVTFSYDNSGLLHVEAVELTSGKRANVSITRNHDASDAKEEQQFAQLRRNKLS